MAKIFNDKIIESLRKSVQVEDDLDSSAYEPGETYMIQQVQTRKKKKPVFRRKDVTSKGACGDGDPDCDYCKIKPTGTLPTRVPLLSKPVTNTCRSRKCRASLTYAEGPSQIIPQYSTGLDIEDQYPTLTSTKISESELEPEPVNISKCLPRTSMSAADSITAEGEPTSIEDFYPESKVSSPLIPAVLERSASKVPGLCYEGLCDPPGRLDYKNISFFRAILGPYPDEPILAMIDKFLSLIGFGGGLCAKDMNKLAFFDDVAEYMPEFNE